MSATEASSLAPTVAFIGLGVMGRSMARHLLDGGHRLVVHTRTREKAEELEKRGATWADSPRQAAAGAAVCLSMVGHPEDVEQVHLGAEGSLSADPPPRLLVDMTTSRPSLARRLAEEAQRRGVGAVDAPVSGGDIGARNATLSIMVGGSPDDVAAAMPVLRPLGKTIVHHGPAGSGQHAKMVNQILIAANMMGVCEGLLYAEAAGLDPLKVIESVASGAAGSWSISNLGPRILRGDFEPGFYVEHFLKDLGIALDEAARMHLSMPALALARQLYEGVRANGMGRKGTQALAVLLARMSGRDERRA